MTLIKSLMLGSAAGIVAVASAQAADLPTRKGAVAVEYVKVCSITVGGTPIVGFVLPGSDTCFKLSGYITGQVEGGNLKTGYALNYNTGVQTPTGTRDRPSLGYTTRLNLTGDAVSNTAYGPAAAHFEVQFENGNGFDNTGRSAYINRAYVTWAGITAGKANSFYSFTGGGPGWANFFSPDQQGFNQPDLMAYTASFGGGFSATIAAQSAYQVANSGCPDPEGGSNCSYLNTVATNYTYAGERVPDVVGNLKVTQAWGSAQVSGVGHYVRADGFDGSTLDKWGYGIDAGVSFNLPTFGAGDDILFTGSYTRNAIWYSGLPDGLWGEGGAANGNGQQLSLADTYRNANGIGWATPTAWTVTATLDHHFSPEFVLSPEASYGEVTWTGTNASSVVSNGYSYLVGGVAHWDPVKAIDFEFELLYQNTHNNTPAGFTPTLANPTFHNNADGFAARFEVTRGF